MMDLRCRNEQRRQALFNNPRWNGIDFLEVGPDQLSLCVHFFGQVPQGLDPRAVRIEGGRRIRDIRVLAVACAQDDDDERDDCLHITLDKYGDFSTYRLCLVDPACPEHPLPGLDPRYACLAFSFKIDCPNPFDCAPAPCVPAVEAPGPDIDYLAKDYDSFRRLLLERLTLSMPEWRERHVPDVGIMLVELLAYTADMLSYYQDAVATEAYLETARRRISVRRHVRLLDYQLHEGCNARAWVALGSDTDRLLPPDVYFVTGSPALAQLTVEYGGPALPEYAVQALPAGRHQGYQPMLKPGADGIALVAAHSRIAFHTWGDTECCLPAGSRRATLRDEDPEQPGRRVLALHRGDVLIFEEVKGPLTGSEYDADPARRHAVRITSVRHDEDGLLGVPVLEIEWGAEDALPFALCLSGRLAAPDCSPVDGISVARGNVVLVEHGMPAAEELGPVQPGLDAGECACEGSIVDMRRPALPFRARLEHAPLVHSVPARSHLPAARSLLQEPAEARPRVALVERGDAGAAWQAYPDLLHSGADERHFVAEIDDDGVAWLRFGDGEAGRMPAADTRFQATYLVGGGTAGNAAAEAIRYLVYREQMVDGSGLTVRNPLPAVGGMAPETVAAARMAAPYAFRTVAQRAVTAADYAELAQRDPRVARAHARLRWNGSWQEAVVALDPLGTEITSPALRRAVAGALYRYRRMGHDLRVVAARYVPLMLELHVCVLPDYVRGHVQAALRERLSNRRLADGSLGFFHPDRLDFGGIVALSALVGAVQAVAGVASVRVLRLHRYGEPPAGEVEAGLLKLAPHEIAQLDNDRDFPEQGQLLLTMDGGR
ncbi:putative phage baseplate assembly protein [Pseudoduganella flava]|uniref:Baseplate assembly protein n=1 Tax=Pseudoduganella flava TaxID=871742 RepID=A0A562Q0Q1_9BURK|nr:putative baseplate assembly protein [Pseudoduganella flava]QGZ38222.1 putative baseplate assembly protein [Pseudoduganella flava]TWI50249.1 putative phage baseplate assembly protein [Pseudoduganella flava]